MQPESRICLLPSMCLCQGCESKLDGKIQTFSNPAHPRNEVLASSAFLGFFFMCISEESTTLKNAVTFPLLGKLV